MIKNVKLIIKKIHPFSGRIENNWLSFKIKNVNLSMKKNSSFIRWSKL